jgi:hypothetical protein
MSNATHWAVSAANKFREVQRSPENPTTNLLAEGLTYLSEAVRDLHQEVDSLESKSRLFQRVKQRHSLLQTERGPAVLAMPDALRDNTLQQAVVTRERIKILEEERDRLIWAYMRGGGRSDSPTVASAD